MPLYFLHFITDGKWVLKMSQGAPMDEIISNACVVASGPGYLHVSCINIGG